VAREIFQPRGLSAKPGRRPRGRIPAMNGTSIKPKLLIF
jgi:hypothetical protein